MDKIKKICKKNMSHLVEEIQNLEMVSGTVVENTKLGKVTWSLDDTHHIGHYDCCSRLHRLSMGNIAVQQTYRKYAR